MIEFKEGAESKFYKSVIVPLFNNYHVTFFIGSCVAFIMSFCYYLGIMEAIPDSKLSLIDLSLNDYFNIMPVTLFYILITIFVSTYISFLLFQLTNYVSKLRVYLRKFTKIKLNMSAREERVVEVCLFMGFLSIVFHFLFVEKFKDVNSFIAAQVYILSSSITYYFYLKTRSDLLINNILENVSLLFLIIMLANVTVILPRKMGIQQYSKKVEPGLLCGHRIKTDLNGGVIGGTLILKLTDVTIYRDCNTSSIKAVYTKTPYIESRI